MAKITKTASGKYHTSVYIGKDINGKKIVKSITAMTKKECRIQAAKAMEQGQKTYCNMTVAEAYQRYIESKANILAPSTLREYRRSARIDFPMLLNIRLDKLTEQIVQVAVNEISEHNAPKTVRNKLYTLKTVVRTYRPDLNLNVRVPQKIKHHPYVVRDGDIQKLLDAADERTRVPILLAAFGSLRREEICALTPDDFTETGVRITKAVVRGEGGYVIKPPKTEAGDRFVPLSKDIVRLALAWERFGINPDTLSLAFAKLRDRVGIPARFHDLRHYYGTHLLRQGMDIKTVCSYGGWDDPTVLLNVYAHAYRDEASDNKVISIADHFFNKKKA